MKASDILELLIRGAAVGGFVLVAIRMSAGARTPARVTGTVFALAAASHTLTQSPAAMSALGVAAAPVWALSVAAAGFFWAFALELFGDRARLSAMRFLPALVLLAFGAAARLAGPEAARGFWLAHNLLGAALMIHVLAEIWTGGRGDLVAVRRRLRGPLLAVAAVYTLAVAAVESSELFLGPATALSALAAASLLALSIASGVIFLRDDERLFGAPAPRPAASSSNIDPRDLALLRRLTAALEVDEVWRQEGLTIGELARRLGAPEHHLRRLINEGLGHRNFAAFLNERRVAAAKAALGDVNDARRPVSAIAFDVGFRSLASFNRVFREVAGATPTAFRAEALGSSISQKTPQD